jgi:predicted RNA-binding Zn ribbon-like protein
MATQAAPGELELVRAFVNTLDVEGRVDELAGPEELAAWLRRHGLMRGSTATRADLVNTRRVREALRALMLANNGVSVRKEAAVTLDRAARRAGISVRFGASGTARLQPAAAGVDGALGRLLAIVAAAMADGTWSRLKACRANDCRWAFYDRARNRSRHWCSMAVCGNRTKARAYRARHAA